MRSIWGGWRSMCSLSPLIRESICRSVVLWQSLFFSSPIRMPWFLRLKSMNLKNWANNMGTEIRKALMVDDVQLHMYSKSQIRIRCRKVAIKNFSYFYRWETEVRKFPYVTTKRLSIIPHEFLSRLISTVALLLYNQMKIPESKISEKCTFASSLLSSRCRIRSSPARRFYYSFRTNKHWTTLEMWHTDTYTCAQWLGEKNYSLFHFDSHFKHIIFQFDSLASLVFK